MPQAPSTQPIDPAAADAHLAQLHKMSTTAGVTNVGYVAVNHTAVAAVLLGLASALAFFGWLLLVVPVVGMIFAIVAIRQISDSSGTQTGKGLAYVGLSLCLLLGGSAILMGAMEIAGVRGDQKAIASTLSQIGSFVRQGQYKEAYALFDSDFHDRVSLQQFQQTWESAQTPPPAGPLGRLESMEWNGVTPIFESQAGSRVALTKVRLKFQRGKDERFDLEMRQVGNRWLITNFSQLFPTRKPQQGRPADQFQL
jgi:hypothetical protein